MTYGRSFFLIDTSYHPRRPSQLVSLLAYVPIDHTYGVLFVLLIGPLYCHFAI